MRWLEQRWYRSGASDHLVCLLLWPLALLFGTLAALRRAAYRLGVFKTAKLAVPVVVVGNITVGGTGKTPLTITLARHLREQNRNPGIVCRGYGSSATAPHAVKPDSDPGECGDEAVLMARGSGCPVWAGANRVATARALLAAQPQCDIILSDDGLQHYALARDFEIAVVDASRGLGNGLLLPAGPLREPPARLATVDAVIMNGNGAPPAAAAAPAYRMTLRGERFRNLKTQQQEVAAAYFTGRAVYAVAAIGNPQRFFDHLHALGIAFDTTSFPDHHAFIKTDLAFANAPEIIMTAKDAVKCEPFASPRHWVLEVEAVIDGDLTGHIMRKLGKSR